MPSPDTSPTNSLGRSARLLVGIPVALVTLGAIAACSADEQDTTAAYTKITAGVDAFEHSGDRDTLIRRREAAVVQCMQDEFGFTYLPVPPDRPAEPPAPDDSQTDYGLVDQYVGADPSETGPATSAEPAGVIDPNEALVAAMSPADADSWRLAAYGLDREYRDAHPESTDARRVGCVNAASAAVLGPENAKLLAELAGAEQEIATRTDEDTDLARTVAEHAACVADRGFGSASATFDPGAILLAEAQRLVPELASQPIADVAAARTGDTQVVEQLRQYERSMYRADISCRDEVKLSDARDDARERATAAFAAERANRFEAYRSMLADVRERAADTSTDGSVHYDFSSRDDEETEAADGAS